MFDQLPDNLRVGRTHRLLRFLENFVCLPGVCCWGWKSMGMDSDFQVCWCVGCWTDSIVFRSGTGIHQDLFLVKICSIVQEITF